MDPMFGGRGLVISLEEGTTARKAARAVILSLLQLVAREQELEDSPDLVGRQQPTKRWHRRAGAAVHHRLFEPRRRQQCAEQLLARAAARLMTPGATSAVGFLAEGDRL